jgi:hypothetical protein
MIVKYLSDNVWGYIDHVRQLATKEFDARRLINKYDQEVVSEEREDIASYLDELKLPEGITMSNKLFIMVGEELKDLTQELNAHTENLVNPNYDAGFPLYAILLYLEDNKEYDAMVLITNQKCYLMNDEGKTIERLS